LSDLIGRIEVHGDTLIITASHHLSGAEMKRLTEMVRRWTPDWPVVIVNDGVTRTVREPVPPRERDGQKPRSAVVERVKLREGDRLVLNVPHRLTADERERLMAMVREWAPGFPVLVLDEGSTLTIVEAVPSPPDTWGPWSFHPHHSGGSSK